MITVDCRSDSEWLAKVLESIELAGCAIVHNVLSPLLLEGLCGAIYEAQDRFDRVVSKEQTDRAGERGVVRLPMSFSPLFYRLLELPEVLAVIDNTISETAILHLQNGFILPSTPVEERDAVFQYRYHMDFQRVMGGYLASVNMLITLSDFTVESGGTLVVPGTHQKPEKPSDTYLKENTLTAECPAGSIIVFDSTLWHAAGVNSSGADRLAVNLQFTRSFIKQQFDYCRALGEDTILAQKPRTQQLLGYYTRTPAGLDEFYVPEEKRFYRSRQG